MKSHAQSVWEEMSALARGIRRSRASECMSRREREPDPSFGPEGSRERIGVEFTPLNDAELTIRGILEE